MPSPGAENARTAGVTVMDIDGVLADVRHRLHYLTSKPKRWDEFFDAASQDLVLPQGLQIASAAAESLVYFSGRPERCRQLTQVWLRSGGFPQAPLHLRPDWDRRPARDYKPEVLARLGGPAAVSVVYDDDERVVQRLTALGFRVVHANWMPSESTTSQMALFDAQEREGRT